MSTRAATLKPVRGVSADACVEKIKEFRSTRGGAFEPTTVARSTSGRLVDVARLAGVSTGTVSNVFNRPERVPNRTATG